MPLVRTPVVRVAALLLSAATLRLDGQAPPPPGSARQGGSPTDGAVAGVASGTVVRSTADGERPVANRWVLLHRIQRTADSVTGAAVDSTLTDRAGRFRLRYTIVPDDSATFFVSTSHHGLAYVSNPLSPQAVADDASLTVYDTTSAAVPISIASRHVIIFAPDSTGAHRVAEIYALSNDTVVTRIAPADGSGVWSASVPAGAVNLLSGLESAAPDSLQLENDRVAAFSPFAPGIKRLAFAYFLPRRERPVSLPIEAPASALEVLVEGPSGLATGAGLVEVSPMSIEGRNFRRFQAQNVAAPTTVLVEMTVALPRRPPALLVALGIAIVLAAGVVIADRRRRAGAVAVPAAVIRQDSTIDAEADALARRIAELDREFARDVAPSDEARERHHALRSELKRELSARLAGRSEH